MLPIVLARRALAGAESQTPSNAPKQHAFQHKLEECQRKHEQGTSSLLCSNSKKDELWNEKAGVVRMTAIHRSLANAVSHTPLITEFEAA